MAISSEFADTVKAYIVYIWCRDLMRKFAADKAVIDP